MDSALAVVTLEIGPELQPKGVPGDSAVEWWVRGDSAASWVKAASAERH